MSEAEGRCAVFSVPVWRGPTAWLSEAMRQRMIQPGHMRLARAGRPSPCHSPHLDEPRWLSGSTEPRGRRRSSRDPPAHESCGGRPHVARRDSPSSPVSLGGDGEHRYSLPAHERHREVVDGHVAGSTSDIVSGNLVVRIRPASCRSGSTPRRSRRPEQARGRPPQPASLAPGVRRRILVAERRVQTARHSLQMTCAVSGPWPCGRYRRPAGRRSSPRHHQTGRRCPAEAAKRERSGAQRRTREACEVAAR